jgi:hypothetical protein
LGWVGLGWVGLLVGIRIRAACCWLVFFPIASVHLHIRVACGLSGPYYSIFAILILLAD